MSQDFVKRKYLEQAQLLLQKPLKTTEKPRANVEPFSCSLTPNSTKHKKDGSKTEAAVNLSTPKSCHCTLLEHQQPDSNSKVSGVHRGFPHACLQSTSSIARSDIALRKSSLCQSEVEISSEMESSMDSSSPYKPSMFDDQHNSSPYKQSQSAVYKTTFPISSTPISKHVNVNSICALSFDGVPQGECHNCSSLEQKLQFLTDVNRELKRLLVASLGSDLKLRIEQLVNEKASISCDLNRSLSQLAENIEEVDRILIECDIWRSKFLASRLMIDELASAKTELSLHFAESQRALQCILKERKELSEVLQECNAKLSELVKEQCVPSFESLDELDHSADLPAQSLPSIKSLGSSRSTVLGVIDDTRTLIKQLSGYSHWGNSSYIGTANCQVTPTVAIQPTKGEQMAKQALQSHSLTIRPNPMPLPMKLRELELSRPQLNHRNRAQGRFWLLDQQTSYPSSLHCRGCKGPAFYV